MKSIFSILIGAVLFWFGETKDFSSPGGILPKEESYLDLDTIPQHRKGDNIRFLQRVGNKLIYNDSWSGPIISLSFHDSETGNLLKTVPVRALNPYLRIGFTVQANTGSENRNEILLHSNQTYNKSQIKAYLPQYLYNEIPDEWEVSQGITICMLTSDWQKSERFIPVYYLMEWEPQEESLFMGDYGVTMVTVIDSTGEEIYRRQFDGLLDDAIVSENGRYLAISYSFYKETKNEEMLRLQNFAELFFLPENRSVWKDSTSLSNEFYNFRNYPQNSIIGAKVKEGDDSCFFYIVDTLNDKIYTQLWERRREMRQIIGVYEGRMFYETVEGHFEKDLNENLQIKNLLKK